MDAAEKLKKLFGARLKSIRESRGFTQDQLAEKAEMNPIYLSKIEGGKENPTLNLLIKVSIALDVDLWELFDFKHEVNQKALKEMMKNFANELDDEKLKMAVRIVRAVMR